VWIHTSCFELDDCQIQVEKNGETIPFSCITASQSENIFIQDCEIVSIRTETSELYAFLFDTCLGIRIHTLLNGSMISTRHHASLLLFVKCEDIKIDHVDAGIIQAGSSEGEWIHPPAASVLFIIDSVRMVCNDIKKKSIKSIAPPLLVAHQNQAIYSMKM